MIPAELPRFEIFRSPDLAEARAVVGGIFSPHQLAPRGCPVGEFFMQYAPIDTLSLCYLDYGAAVDIEADMFGSFFLLQFPLRGTMEAHCPESDAMASRGAPVVLSATRQWNLRWSADCASLLVRIDRHEAESALARMLGQPLTDPLVFETQTADRGRGVPPLWYSVRSLVEDLRGGAMLTWPAARRAAEQAVIHSLLCTWPHNYSLGLTGGRSPAAPRHVTRVESYIRAHASEPVTIEELVSISGASLRSLYDGFRKFRDTSPMRYLRDYRLDQVHTELTKPASDTSVTTVAMRWGFNQLGRFAAQYKERYGESPSETLKNARFTGH